MTENQKLILGLMQVENLIKLLENNEYEKYFYSKLTKIKIELERQLSLENKTK